MPTLERFLASINRQILQKVVGNTYGVWAEELGFRRRGKQVPGSPRGERAGGGVNVLGLTTQRAIGVCTKQRP